MRLRQRKVAIRESGKLGRAALRHHAVWARANGRQASSPSAAGAPYGGTAVGYGFGFSVGVGAAVAVCVGVGVGAAVGVAAAEALVLDSALGSLGSAAGLPPVHARRPAVATAAPKAIVAAREIGPRGAASAGSKTIVASQKGQRAAFACTWRRQLEQGTRCIDERYHASNGHPSAGGAP